MADEKINVRGLAKLELSETTLVAVMDGLGELAYRRAVPALVEIETQLRAQFAPKPDGDPA